MVSYLQVEDLTKSYGDIVLFENISLGISKGQKVALIAKNGTGKTSLLNILAGKDTQDNGKITYKNDLTIGYFEQIPELKDENTILEEVFESSTELLNTVKEYEKCILSENQENLEELISKMDNLNAWNIEAKIKEILGKLKLEDVDKKIGTLSGGQKKRVGLAKVLINDPEFLILDEPTNHLDVEMIEWLEEYLITSNTTLLMVTHDRYFLDRVCNEIIELENNTIYSYKGNYTYYLEKREERIELMNSEIEKAQNLYRKEKEWMSRMPKARSHKAKYRIDAFHEIKAKAHSKKEEKVLDIDIQSKRLGGKILELNRINKSFDDLNILNDFTYKFSRFEKIGIVGKNGTGKSTFLNIITQNLAPDSGDIEIGETVTYGYYKQDGITISDNERVIDVIKNISESITLGKNKVMSASQFLEYFLFPPKMQYTYVSKLSGGEKRRLYLMTVLMKNPNFLILDEPTNDLDIVTLNVLENYLKNFSGCLIIVSHDRYFMDKIVDHLFVFEGNGVIKDFPGNYTIYRDYKTDIENKEKQLISEQKPKKQKPQNDNKPKKMSFKEKKEFEQLEIDIENLNSEKKETEDLLNSGSLSSDELMEKSKRIAEIIDLLDEKEMRWLELSELS